jgi:hypothetical protein
LIFVLLIISISHLFQELEDNKCNKQRVQSAAEILKEQQYNKIQKQSTAKHETAKPANKVMTKQL